MSRYCSCDIVKVSQDRVVGGDIRSIDGFPRSNYDRLSRVENGRERHVAGLVPGPITRQVSIGVGWDIPVGSVTRIPVSYVVTVVVENPVISPDGVVEDFPLEGESGCSGSNVVRDQVG